MTEEFLHYLWKYKYFKTENLQTQDSKPIEVISVGFHNSDSGADFSNAQIKIDNTLWVGNVEIHLKTSDWERHLHNQDDAYNNVILHVVYEADCKTYNHKNQEIPVLCLHFDHKMYENYLKLKQTPQAIACAEHFADFPEFMLANWQDKLVVERLEEKTLVVENLLQQTKNDWNECFYIFLARGFGANLNAYAFESLAKSLPQKILAKHKNSLFQLEALLFGQAGMLEKEDISEKYYLDLRKEYKFLKLKYNLQPVDTFLWKFLRLRPINFPTVRISQFAQLVYSQKALLATIMHANSLKEIEKLFELKTSEFWESHYTFEKKSPEKIKSFGKKSAETLIINSVIPFIFLYGKKRSLPKKQQDAIEYMEQIKPELNKITKSWQDLGMKFYNSYQTQAMIQLHNSYCKNGKCLDCGIGNFVLKKNQL